MNDVSYPVHRGAHDVAVRNVSAYDFQLPASFEEAIVTKGSNCHIVGTRAVQEALDKLTAHFSSCA
jgi:hypothetical protein